MSKDRLLPPPPPVSKPGARARKPLPPLPPLPGRRVGSDASTSLSSRSRQKTEALSLEDVEIEASDDDKGRARQRTEVLQLEDVEIEEVATEAETDAAGETREAPAIDQGAPVSDDETPAEPVENASGAGDYPVFDEVASTSRDAASGSEGSTDEPVVAVAAAAAVASIEHSVASEADQAESSDETDAPATMGSVVPVDATTSIVAHDHPSDHEDSLGSSQPIVGAGAVGSIDHVAGNVDADSTDGSQDVATAEQADRPLGVAAAVGIGSTTDAAPARSEAGAAGEVSDAEHSVARRPASSRRGALMVVGAAAMLLVIWVASSGGSNDAESSASEGSVAAAQPKRSSSAGAKTESTDHMGGTKDLAATPGRAQGSTPASVAPSDTDPVGATPADDKLPADGSPSTAPSGEPTPEANDITGADAAANDSESNAASPAAATRSGSRSGSDEASGAAPPLPPGLTRDPDPRSAPELLVAAKRAYQDGNGREAYRLASLSLSADGSNTDAKRLKVLAACKMKNRATAKAVFDALPSEHRDGLRSECRDHGVRLGL